MSLFGPSRDEVAAIAARDRVRAERAKQEYEYAKARILKAMAMANEIHPYPLTGVVEPQKYDQLYLTTNPYPPSPPAYTTADVLHVWAQQWAAVFQAAYQEVCRMEAFRSPPLSSL